MTTPPSGSRVDDFLAAPRRFAILATLDPDGTPRQAVIWYRLDPDGRITVNSAEGRRWPANLRRDPRCSLAVVDGAEYPVPMALSQRTGGPLLGMRVRSPLSELVALSRGPRSRGQSSARSGLTHRQNARTSR